MKAASYERVVEAAISNATVLDQKAFLCQDSFIPDTKVGCEELKCEIISPRLFKTQGKTYVLYIKMVNSRDTTTWLQTAKVRVVFFVAKLSKFTFLSASRSGTWTQEARTKVYGAST